MNENLLMVIITIIILAVLMTLPILLGPDTTPTPAKETDNDCPDH